LKYRGVLLSLHKGCWRQRLKVEVSVCSHHFLLV
jgi:hypothetical protein